MISKRSDAPRVAPAGVQDPEPRNGRHEHSRMRPALVLGFALLAASGIPALAGKDDVMEIKWSRLAPPPPASARTFLPKGGAQPPAADPGNEGGWMTGNKTVTSTPPVVATDLAGQRVRLGGYVVALDFNATRVTEFLLVPFVGACVHVPPPPANQIVYVKYPKGLELQGQFDPVYVTGPLSIDFTPTGLADAGYAIVADKIEPKAQ